MAGNYDRVFGQRQELVMDRSQNLAPVAAGQVGAPDAIPEQGIAGDQFVLSWNP